MDAISNLITSPVQPWDALICTSKAVKNNVEKVLQAQINYLKDRLGITKFTAPQLPVIPLGIHTDDFNFSQNEIDSARKNLGISETTIVVLYLGRLSFHAKAHPLAMYQALEKAVKNTNSLAIFKARLNQHLKKLPDFPPVQGYVRANNNTIMDWANFRGTDVHPASTGEGDLPTNPTAQGEDPAIPVRTD